MYFINYDYSNNKYDIKTYYYSYTDIIHDLNFNINNNNNNNIIKLIIWESLYF